MSKNISGRKLSKNCQNISRSQTQLSRRGGEYSRVKTKQEIIQEFNRAKEKSETSSVELNFKRILLLSVGILGFIEPNPFWWAMAQCALQFGDYYTLTINLND